MASIGSALEAKLARGNVQKAFCHLKGWYRAAAEMQARPCFQTMARQTANRVDLYARRPSQGDPLLTLINLVAVNNDVPSDGKICHAASLLSNGCTTGASGMRAKDVKA